MEVLGKCYIDAYDSMISDLVISRFIANKMNCIIWDQIISWKIQYCRISAFKKRGLSQKDVKRFNKRSVIRTKDHFSTLNNLKTQFWKQKRKWLFQWLNKVIMLQIELNNTYSYIRELQCHSRIHRHNYKWLWNLLRFCFFHRGLTSSHWYIVTEEKQ